MLQNFWGLKLKNNNSRAENNAMNTNHKSSRQKKFLRQSSLSKNKQDVTNFELYINFFDIKIPIGSIKTKTSEPVGPSSENPDYKDNIGRNGKYKQLLEHRVSGRCPGKYFRKIKISTPF